MNTNRSRRGAGTHVYNPHLLDNRSTSSSVRKAGALVPSPPCLGEGPHGWVPVDTHRTPVLTSVRRLWVAYVVYEPNTPQEHVQLAHQRREIDHSLACDEQLRRDQQLIHEQSLEQNMDLREAHMKSLNEMEELKRFQGSTFDEFSRRRLTEDRDTVLELTGKIQNYRMKLIV